MSMRVQVHQQRGLDFGHATSLQTLEIFAALQLCCLASVALTSVHSPRLPPPPPVPSFSPWRCRLARAPVAARSKVSRHAALTVVCKRDWLSARGDRGHGCLAGPFRPARAAHFSCTHHLRLYLTCAQLLEMASHGAVSSAVSSVPERCSGDIAYRRHRCICDEHHQ